MRILLIANFRPDGQESMARFCELIRCGVADENHEVVVLGPEAFFVKLLRGRPAAQKWLGYLDKYFLFPFVLWKAVKSYDLIHICDHSNAVYTRFLRGQRHLITCHDLLAVRSALGEIPENPTGWSGRILQREILSGLERAQFVVCVSESTRGELLRLTHRDPGRTSCILNGLNYPYRPMEAAKARQRVQSLIHGQSKSEPLTPFLLHVGGNQWYKNRPGVLKIFESLRARPEFSGHRLIMAGKPFSSEMRNLISSLGLDSEVVEVTSVPNEDLRALYSLADGLVFPSLAEGFGWPIVEAQACGCPVYTSRRSPMNEIGGQAARYFDPADPCEAASVISGAIDEGPEMAAAGLNNARRFGSAEMLRAYRETYRRCLEA